MPNLESIAEREMISEKSKIRFPTPITQSQADELVHHIALNLSKKHPHEVRVSVREEQVTSYGPTYHAGTDSVLREPHWPKMSGTVSLTRGVYLEFKMRQGIDVDDPAYRSMVLSSFGKDFEDYTEDDISLMGEISDAVSLYFE